MLREPREAQPTTEPRQEVKERKPRFQIVKLEERIAPFAGSDNRKNCFHGRPCPRV